MWLLCNELLHKEICLILFSLQVRFRSTVKACIALETFRIHMNMQYQSLGEPCLLSMRITTFLALDLVMVGIGDPSHLFFMLFKFESGYLLSYFALLAASTHDQDVFCFYPDDRPCNGFEEALSRYREIAPQLRLAGSYIYFFIMLSTWDCSSLILFILFNFRANVLCSNNWDGYDNCGTEWWAVSCFIDNCWWTGTSSHLRQFLLWFYSTL